MTGTIVVLDPGHGGVEEGAVGPTGLREKDVTLDLARLHADAPHPVGVGQRGLGDLHDGPLRRVLRAGLDGLGRAARPAGGEPPPRQDQERAPARVRASDDRQAIRISGRTRMGTSPDESCLT